MGSRGPKPQPTVLKLARGNPGKRAVNQAEPELASPASKVPAGLTGRAKAEWQRLAGELIDKGVLTVGDMTAFEQYCITVGEVYKYQELIKKAPSVAEAHRLGYANYLLKLRAQLLQQAAHLGLTPSSRSGVKSVGAVKKDAEADKRARFFGASKKA